MKLSAICVLLTTMAMARAAPGYVSPVILPKVQLASPDVTVVKQPYVIHQTEPVYRHVYYADPLSAVVPPYVTAYHDPQPAPPTVYHHHAPYAVNYVV